MKIHRGVAALLKQAGATFVRRSKHYIFALPNGKKLTVAGTPSDRYAVNNQIREIKKAGGLVEEQKKNPDRVEKQGRTDERGRRLTREWLGADKDTAIPAGKSLAAQLSSTGIAERALRQQIEHLNAEMKIKCATILYQERRLENLMSWMDNWKCPCWFCRLRRFFHV